MKLFEFYSAVPGANPDLVGFSILYFICPELYYNFVLG